MANVGSCSKLTTIAFVCLFIFIAQAKKTLDPYKVLGVDRNASQRDIQKAFHKLSLQYHPDKNKNKGAQQKFEEINNAYDILSDEQKRKNYDLYGDESGGTSFGGRSAGDYGGYSYFTGGRQGQSGFSFRPDEWQNMGGQGSRSFSFSFGGPGGGNPFGFGLNDIFSNLFGGDTDGSGFGGSFGSQFGGSRTKAGSQSGFKSPPKAVLVVTSQVFEKEIKDKGIAWLLLFYMTSTMSTQQYEAILQEIAISLKGALKVGKVNCENEPSFCKNHGLHPRRAPRLFIYSYLTTDGGSFVEYNDDLDTKNLKSFCQENLPRYSKRVSLDNFEPSFVSRESIPRVILLSSKKDTPVIWRALSGLYHKRLIFFDAQVHDASDPNVKKLGVNALPAIVGWLSNGEKQILKAGISVKHLESAVQELSLLLESFEKKNKKIASSQKKSEIKSSSKQIPHLMASNLNAVCGEETPVCLIGAFRSSKAKDKLESILLMASQKSLSRRRNLSSDSKDSVSYTLLDATKQQSFLHAFDKSGFKSLDSFLVAYKPRKGKYAVFSEDVTPEEAEKFIGSVLSGDVQFSKTRQKPTFN